MENSGVKIIIGLTGLKAAGKDELSNYLQSKGFASRSCSDEIRAELQRRGNVKPTVDDLVAMGNEGRSGGSDMGYWARRAADTLVNQGQQFIIINGMRHPDEVKELRRIYGDAFTLVGIIAPLPLRANRLLSRARAGDPKTVEEFMKLDDTDRGIGQPWHGQQVDRTLALTDFQNVFNNKGTLEEYHAWIDALVARLTAPRP